MHSTSMQKETREFSFSNRLDMLIIISIANNVVATIGQDLRYTIQKPSKRVET